jgi:hypothetical protein
MVALFFKTKHRFGFTVHPLHDKLRTVQITFSFRSAMPGRATLDLYDANGKQVAQLFNRRMEKGMVQQVMYDTRKLPAGLYVSRLQTGAAVSQQKLIVRH